MIDSTKSYPFYKNTGIPWLGNVPKHWEVQKLRNLLSLVANRNRPDLPLLSVVREKGVILRDISNMDENFNYIPDDLSNYKVVHIGQFAMNKMKAWQGSYGVSPYKGIVSPAYFVFNLNGVHRNFFHLAIRSKCYVAFFAQASDGVRIGQWDLSQIRMKEIPFCIPSVSEQVAIVHFIKYVDKQIKQYIRARQSLVSLAAEKREKITNDALEAISTRNLRLNAIIERMERPIDRLSNQVYTPIGLFNRGRGIFHKDPVIGSDLGDSHFYWINEGDLVFSGQFAWEGAVALAQHDDSGCIASHRYPVYRGKVGLAESAYLLAFFKSSMGHLLLDLHSRGAAGRNRPLNDHTLMKEKIPIPSLPAQLRVAEIAQMENRLQLSVNKIVKILREYRNRLVSEVVTGKLDVREAAKTLPILSEELLDELITEELAEDAGESNLELVEDQLTKDYDN